MWFKHEEDNCIVLEQEQLDFLQLLKSSVYWARAVGSACAHGNSLTAEERGWEQWEDSCCSSAAALQHRFWYAALHLLLSPCHRHPHCSTDRHLLQAQSSVKIELKTVLCQKRAFSTLCQHRLHNKPRDHITKKDNSLVKSIITMFSLNFQFGHSGLKKLRFMSSISGNTDAECRHSK